MPGEDEIREEAIGYGVADGGFPPVRPRHDAFVFNGKRVDEQVARKVGSFLFRQHLVEGFLGAPV